ncbi:hypothetical protein SAMN04487785_103149 [Dyella jiangningensis]|nr:hypothetical protein BDW41_101434 [Dyella sp. AtDHG13]SDJ67197.1 hypothetical protein SAMN04487785_103149 [Dyella jiangningensis]
MFAWECKLGLSLSDEGYLWYGVQRVLHGEVPLRDFMAYDPGRYYWSAAWMALRGNEGIIGVRMALAGFEFLGLWAALRVVAKTLPDDRRGHFLLVLAWALTLLAWMVPRHKLFDISLCLFLFAALSWLIEHPVRARYVAVGTIVGLVACFGRNHGLYGGVASVGAMAWLSIRRGAVMSFVRGLCYWCIGFAVGLLPLFVMMLCLPGFAGAVTDSVLLLLAQGSTNISLPVPWPWRLSWGGAPGQEVVSQILVGFYFLALPAFCVLSIVWCFRQRFAGRTVPPAFVACAMLSLPYAHFAFSRADASHLAQGLFPLLLGVCLLALRLPFTLKWGVTAVMLATGIMATLSLHPGWQYRPAAQPVTIESYGDTLKVDAATAAQVSLFRTLVAAHAGDSGTFIAVPFFPGAYALMGRRSPTWELYPLFARSEAFQEQEILRLRAAPPSFILVADDPLDGRDDLRFSRTHVVEFAYFSRKFERSPEMAGSSYLFVPVVDPSIAPGIH